MNSLLLQDLVNPKSASLSLSPASLSPSLQFDFTPSQRVVYHSTPVLSWRYYHSTNFFHFLTEAVTALIVGLRAVNGADVHVLADHRQVTPAWQTTTR